MSKESKEKLALMISGVFTPPLLAVVVIVGIAWYYAENITEVATWSAIGIGLTIVPPTIYIYIAHKIGKLKDISLSDREERFTPIAVALLGSIVGMLILNKHDAPDGIKIVGYIMLVELGLIMLVSQFWKISVHMITLSTVVTIFVLLYSKIAIVLYLLIFPVAWARIYRKKHTLMQTIVGTAAGVIIAYIIIEIFT